MSFLVRRRPRRARCQWLRALAGIGQLVLSLAPVCRRGCQLCTPVPHFPKSSGPGVALPIEKRAHARQRPSWAWGYGHWVAIPRCSCGFRCSAGGSWLATVYLIMISTCSADTRGYGSLATGRRYMREVGPECFDGIVVRGRASPEPAVYCDPNGRAHGVRVGVSLLRHELGGHHDGRVRADLDAGAVGGIRGCLQNHRPFEAIARS